jgi:hypothetical protein
MATAEEVPQEDAGAETHVNLRAFGTTRQPAKKSPEGRKIIAQRLKPDSFSDLYGTSEAVPLQRIEVLRKLQGRALIQNQLPDILFRTVKACFLRDIEVSASQRRLALRSEAS